MLHSGISRMAAVLLLFFAGTGARFCLAEPPPPPDQTIPLFDGTTLNGWEGKASLWRVQDGALTGGSLQDTIPQNEFLASRRDFTNFIVRFKIKLIGTNGFINSGFQIRSHRVPNNSEMAGYQCDFGEPNWYGAIYDESRRNQVMAPSDMDALGPVIRRNGWNDYVIRADGPDITTWINGVLGADYTEADATIPESGKLGIQVHGGGKALVQVKDLTIEELPPLRASRRFRGAPEPPKASQPSPLSPDAERAAFTLPPGFEIELVAAESEGIGKFVAVDWDLSGRLWTMTALEYPVDANESPAVARELYASKARDKIIVFDRDPQSPTGYSSKPRVFADGLAIPLGILPYQKGVYVQHGTEIVFLSDGDSDGQADRREIILSGFGVQDSHLFPHQFTRGPGNWMWMAQGAFNYGKVRTKDGREQQFDMTRMAKFRADGSDFEITSQGPCNIWGLALTAEGESWIQEANDYGYPVMPFHEYANYPGCSDAEFKSYAPEFPGTAPHFKMGGTGLSGLALSDAPRDPQESSANAAAYWPEAYTDVMYLANPITRRIQAIKITRDGPRFRYRKLPDFIQSSDEMFRPVALRLGPDGCLYIVDWYNKIISHNEVPRDHPERDKKRGRIWRVKHRDVAPLTVPDFSQLADDDLVARLGGVSTTQSHLAWQAITDRQRTGLAPKLRRIITDPAQSPARRIASLWALEGLRETAPHGSAGYLELLQPLLTDPNRNVRREAVRVLGENPPGLANEAWAWERLFATLDLLAADTDPQVRAEVIKTAGRCARRLNASSDRETAGLLRRRALPLLVRMAQSSLEGPTAASTQNANRRIKISEAYEREFERYLVRLFLERLPGFDSTHLESESVQSLPVENRLVAALALSPKAGAASVARLLPQLARAPGPEEMLRLAQFPDEPGVGAALQGVLQNVNQSIAALEALLKVRTKLDEAKLRPILEASARILLPGNEAARALAVRLASAFKLTALEPDLLAALRRQPTLALLGALREMGASQPAVFADLARTSPDAAIRNEAIRALASSKGDQAVPLLLASWPDLNAQQRKTTLAGLAGTPAGASALIRAVKSGGIEQADLDAPTLDKLSAVLPNDAELKALVQAMDAMFRPALRLNGADDAWVDSDLTLDGPFTVETWIKLDPGIDNNDGILGSPGVLDMNFFGGQFRVFVGGGIGDVIVAKKKMVPESWTHLAVSREAAGKFRIYLNGELDTADSKVAPQRFEHCRIGWSTPNRGTAGWLTEYRVWNRARSEDEIRADFDRSYEGGTVEASGRPAGMDFHAAGLGPWGKLQAGARIEKASDSPPLLTAAEARSQETLFTKYRALASSPGDANHGRELATTTCLICHSVDGQGAQIGPVLNGASALGTESLLRAVLTPNAAMEAGYRMFRVELKDGDVLDGLVVSQDEDAIILRRPSSEDLRISQTQIRRAGYLKQSMMPAGLLDAMSPREVSDLFSYLKTLQ